MDTKEIKKLLIDIPTRICRSLSQKFISTILKDLPVSLSQHHLAILNLLDDNKSLIISEFVETLNITKPQMTASADKLVELGFISRKNDDKDRRKIFLTITKKGTEIISDINQNIDIEIDKNLAELSESELLKLSEGLKVLQKLCEI